MKMLLVLRQDPADLTRIPEAERAPLVDEYRKVREFLEQSGALVASSGLLPQGRTLHRTGDDYVVTDGPYSTGHEMLNGFMLFEAASLDEAEQIARRLPTGDGNSIELRPLLRQD